MMIGVAQVIGIKPTFNLVFSSFPGAAAKASLAIAIGNNAATADIAVDEPTAFKNPRRRLSSGNSALKIPCSTTRLLSASSCCASALLSAKACSASLLC